MERGVIKYNKAIVQQITKPDNTDKISNKICIYPPKNIMGYNKPQPVNIIIMYTVIFGMVVDI